MMLLDVFGKKVEVKKDSGKWKVFYTGPEGKKRPAHDILIPDSVNEADLLEYIADICHEWANEKNQTVFILSK